MLNGLYKVEFETPRRRNVGVIYANGGKLYGGSGTFSYIGTYEQHGNTIRGVVTTKRHTDDPDHPPVFEFSGVRITFNGVEKNGLASIEGTADEAPELRSRRCLLICPIDAALQAEWLSPVSR